ncbi:antibiotic biosynthesis monooxygenase family protein [Rhizobium rhizoryzae]|jgi:heme-degrading monooxygenase HmoA|uniref:antibiotic biosynthesis monooxygenase family protein n=1 Tax=Rhizobium rhizoryzae TaxID=451876 RepID=UPI00289F36FB|nr:antibiotic biosynthesis monooxygenase [Rhizobium rhizoryzae]
MSAEPKDRFAALPKPPYFMVAFSSHRTVGDCGYADMAQTMLDLAEQQPGYLGYESVRGADGFGIANSYWIDEASIIAWKQVVDHLAAQEQGRRDWYERYEVRIALVQRAYGFVKD